MLARMKSMPTMMPTLWQPLREIMALMRVRVFYVTWRRRQRPLRLLILALAAEEQPLLRMPAQRQPTTVTPLQRRAAAMKSADTLQLLPLLLLMPPLQQNPLHPTAVELWKMMVLAQSLPGPRGKTGGRNWVCKGAASR